MEGLDMTLDDMIRKNRILKRKRHISESSDAFPHGSGRDRDHAPGPTRHSPDGSSPSRTMPSSTVVNQLPGMQRRNLTIGGPSAGNAVRRYLTVEGPNSGNAGRRYLTLSSEDADTVLRVSGLSSHISHDDIRILFSDVGRLNWYSIRYDEHGVFKGDADVAYQLRSEALEAIRRYHNRLLDGNRMSVRRKITVIAGHRSPRARNDPNTPSGLEMPAGSSGRRDETELDNRPRKMMRRRKKAESSRILVEQLNAELDQYQEEGKQHRM